MATIETVYEIKGLSAELLAWIRDWCTEQEDTLERNRAETDPLVRLTDNEAAYASQGLAHEGRDEWVREFDRAVASARREVGHETIRPFCGTPEYLIEMYSAAEELQAAARRYREESVGIGEELLTGSSVLLMALHALLEERDNWEKDIPAGTVTGDLMALARRAADRPTERP